MSVGRNSQELIKYIFGINSIAVSRYNFDEGNSL